MEFDKFKTDASKRYLQRGSTELPTKCYQKKLCDNPGTIHNGQSQNITDHQRISALAAHQSIGLNSEIGSGKTKQIMRPLSKAALLDTAAHLTAAAVTRGGDRQSYRMVFVSGMPGIIEVQQRIRFVAERCKIPVSHCEIIDPVHTLVLLEFEKNNADRVARVRSELATHLYDVDDRALVVSMQRDMVDTATGQDGLTSSNVVAMATMSRSMERMKTNTGNKNVRLILAPSARKGLVQQTYRHLCERCLPSIFLVTSIKWYGI